MLELQGGIKTMTFTWNLKEFFIANRYNLLHHLSHLLGAIAYSFAIIAVYTVNVLPGLSDVAEMRSCEFSEYSKGVYRYALTVTMRYTWAKMLEEKDKEVH
jgi:hypothetical protein